MWVNNIQGFYCESYAYWTVHHLDIWIKGRPTWWHLLYYVNLLLNMFRMLIHPSSGVVVQPALGYHITNNQSRYITPTHLKSAHYNLHSNAPSNRKLLKMDVLTSETCWAVDNKASVIKLVNLYSNIKMMHGPIRIRLVTVVYIWRDLVSIRTCDWSDSYSVCLAPHSV